LAFHFFSSPCSTPVQTLATCPSRPRRLLSALADNSPIFPFPLPLISGTLPPFSSLAPLDVVGQKPSGSTLFLSPSLSATLRPDRWPVFFFFHPFYTFFLKASLCRGFSPSPPFKSFPGSLFHVPLRTPSSTPLSRFDFYGPLLALDAFLFLAFESSSDSSLDLPPPT